MKPSLKPNKSLQPSVLLLKTQLCDSMTKKTEGTCGNHYIALQNFIQASIK